MTTIGLQADPSFGVRGKKRWAMVVDLRRCIGCMACVAACTAEYDVPFGVGRTTVQVKNTGMYPNTRRKFMPLLCNHCDTTPCWRTCPTGRTYNP